MTGTVISTGQAVVTTGGNKVTGPGFTGGINGTSPLTIGVSQQDANDWIGSFQIVYEEAGVREYPGATFAPAQPVFRGADGFPTQTQGGADNYTVLGVALSATRVLLLLPQIGVARDAAPQRPMSIGDDNALPHQATAAERPLHKDFLGLGGPTAPAPAAAREVTVAYVDDTHLQIKMKGVDGTIRSITLTLA